MAFPDQHSLHTKFGVENITDMCSNGDNGCYKLKLRIPTGNYISPEYLAEDIQASIDRFGLLVKNETESKTWWRCVDVEMCICGAVKMWSCVDICRCGDV